MKCPTCQFENPKGIKFCRECGSSLELEMTCPNCSSTQPSEPAPKDLSFDEKFEKIQKYLPGGLTDKILSQRERLHTLAAANIRQVFL